MKGKRIIEWRRPFKFQNFKKHFDFRTGLLTFWGGGIVPIAVYNSTKNIYNIHFYSFKKNNVKNQSEEKQTGEINLN